MLNFLLGRWYRCGWSRHRGGEIKRWFPRHFWRPGWRNLIKNAVQNIVFNHLSYKNINFRTGEPRNRLGQRGSCDVQAWEIFLLDLRHVMLFLSSWWWCEGESLYESYGKLDVGQQHQSLGRWLAHPRPELGRDSNPHTKLHRPRRGRYIRLVRRSLAEWEKYFKNFIKIDEKV